MQPIASGARALAERRERARSPRGDAEGEREAPRAGETDPHPREAAGADAADDAVDLGDRDPGLVDQVLTQHEHLLRDMAAASLALGEHDAIAPQARRGGGGRGVDGEQQHRRSLRPITAWSRTISISRASSLTTRSRTRTSAAGTSGPPRAAHSMKVARTPSKYGSRSASSSSPSAAPR